MTDTINLRDLIPQLEPDRIGLFEPVSALMRLNISQEDYKKHSQRFVENSCTEHDIVLISTINHETCHFAQFASSGYGFHRQLLQLAALNTAAEEPEPPIDPNVAIFAEIVETGRKMAGDDPALNRRLDRAIAVAEDAQYFQQLDANAPDGDASVAGGLAPGFFRTQAELTESENAIGPDGISILGVLEGAAVVHTRLMMRSPDPRTAIEKDLAQLTPVYHQLYGFTGKQSGDRVFELMLPATALALRYAKPHIAYTEILDRLTSSSPGAALQYGRELANNLPEIEAAGSILGAASDIRKHHDSYLVYDRIINELATGKNDVDEYMIVADPEAINRLEIMPFAVITNDGWNAGKISMSMDDLIARMAIMGFVMKAQKRRRAERSFYKAAWAWGHEVVNRLA